ncbi:MAG: NAD-dependent deacylase, partial [Pseudomonadota bacterium]
MTVSGKIVILTGAGVSAESGLGTFRDAGGLWSQYNLSEVATPEGFAANPDLVHDFYNARRANCLEAEPNEAHRALARLQKGRDGVVIVSQNIDDLHERGGASMVIHMHGELMRALCANCGHRWDAPREMKSSDPCPKCAQPSTRPDIVWFGEIPYQMERIDTELRQAALFVAIGTSGEVYPAAGFVQQARALGAETLEINLEPSGGARQFDAGRYGPATEIVPAWVDEILAG